MSDIPVLEPARSPKRAHSGPERLRLAAAWTLCFTFFFLVPLEWASLEWERTEKGMWRISAGGEEGLFLAGMALLWALINLAAGLTFLITGGLDRFSHERRGACWPPRLRDVAYYFAWVQCLITGLFFLSEWFFPGDARSGAAGLFLQYAPHSIMIAVFLILFRRHVSRFGFRGVSLAGWIRMVVAVGVLYGFVYFFLDPWVTEPVARYFSLEPESWREESIAEGIGEAGRIGLFALLSQLLLVGVIGPVGEEIVFRGVLQQSLVPRVGNLASVFLSSLVFAVFHVDVVLLAPLLVLGLILGTLGALFRSLWAPILFHVVNNTVSVILDLIHR